MATSIGTLAEKALITPDIDLESHLRKTYKLPAMSQNARKAYEETQKLKQEGAQIAHEQLKSGNDLSQTNNTNDKSLVKTNTAKPNPAQVKASLDAARERARIARVEMESSNRNLIDVLATSN
jgi:paraquat-inducible protein B